MIKFDETAFSSLLTVQSTIETITPAQSRQLLEHNKINRLIKPQGVKKLVREMTEGRWLVNGEAIIIDTQGNVVDGQHRLLAAVEANYTFTTVVVRGVTPETRFTVDSGIGRSLADALKMQGVPQAAAMGGALRLLWRYQNKTMLNRTIFPSIQEGWELYKTSPALRESLLRIGNVPFSGGVGTYGFIHYVLWVKDADLAEEFFTGFIDGTGLEKGNPILALRQRLINAGAGMRYGRDISMRSEMRAAFMFKAYMMWTKNQSCSLLRWTESEAFPYV